MEFGGGKRERTKRGMLCKRCVCVRCEQGEVMAILGLFPGKLMTFPMGVPRGVPVGVPMGVPVGVPLGVLVGVPVGMPVALPVAVPVWVLMGVPVGVPVGMNVHEDRRHIWGTRRRKVKRTSGGKNEKENLYERMRNVKRKLR